MLHLFFKWRYDRRTRQSSFRLPKENSQRDSLNSNLNDYISRGFPQSRGFRHYDRPRRRKRIAQITAALLGIALLIWITYESILAIAAMGN